MSRMWLASRPLALAALWLPLVTACAASRLAAPEQTSDYLRYVAFEAPGHEHLLLRWPERSMPLRIYLPPPPADLFEDPRPWYEAAREGVLAWTDAAGPGLPGFEFVASAGESDFPIAWAGSQPSVAIAHCGYVVVPRQRRFQVTQIVVTGRFGDGRLATPEIVRQVLTHEVGHALGLGGHSPNPEDVMYGFLDTAAVGSGAEAPAAPPMRGELTDRDRETLRLLYESPIGRRVSAPRRAY